MSSSAVTLKRSRSVSPAAPQKKTKPGDAPHFTSPFLKLPAEIRNMIYKELIGNIPLSRFKINKCHLRNSYWHPVLKKSNGPIGRIRYDYLRSTCRQVRAEIMSVFWESNDAHLCTCALSKQFLPVTNLQTGSQHQFSFLSTANLQQITLQIHAGKHDFRYLGQCALFLEAAQFSGSLLLVGPRFDVNQFKKGLVVICTSHYESTGSLAEVCEAVYGDAVFKASKAQNSNVFAPSNAKGKKNPIRTFGHEVPATYTEKDKEIIEFQLRLNFKTRA
ncbi:hypothetical protein GTA08_BOTSDO13786 [Botryosphaeria dothidea]|uniref:F-box domain-containing protein n=1 Tax=Botryosphaeria dothidea TaxID=55169 RepID=A0A8H4J088_9PEZI|nr:hypothetical protein GTA08_BOTSDO13786 [Botryosphaeria dothidea]